jgi:hypothetical protein
MAWPKSSGVLALALLAGLGGVAAADTPSALALSFSAARDERRLVQMDATSHFHVLLTNRSDRSQRIWETWNSWGYYSLSFEVIDRAGEKRVVKKLDTNFTRNFPSSLAIAPGQTYVFDVYFGDGKTWGGFPIRPGEEQTVQIRAVYDIPTTPESTAHNVWTGHLESESIQATFVR